MSEHLPRASAALQSRCQQPCPACCHCSGQRHRAGRYRPAPERSSAGVCGERLSDQIQTIPLIGWSLSGLREMVETILPSQAPERTPTPSLSVFVCQLSRARIDCSSRMVPPSESSVAASQLSVKARDYQSQSLDLIQGGLPLS